MSGLVVDASVSVKWFANEPDADIADQLVISGRRLFAPRIIFTEVANALCRKSIAGLMTAEEASGFWRSLPSYLHAVISLENLLEPALRMACTLRHPIYDLIYLETARRLDAQLITADRRFIAKLTGTDLARYVTHLSDWQPA
ncbi:type II toxin-antitoxin system VapC family toxin [soil metagenome]